MCAGLAQKIYAQEFQNEEQLKKNFKTPPENKKPWVYWYWINNHISKKGITKDLEAMSKIGIGAALIGNIYLDNVEEGKVPMLSEKWKELTEHAIREGGRLGVDIGLFNSPGWSQSGGPWNDTSNSMRYLTSTEKIIEGGKEINIQLTKPTPDFEDVSLLAFPSKKEQISGNTFQVSSDENIANLQNLSDQDLSTTIDLSGIKNANFIFKSQKPVSVRSLSITPSKSTLMMKVRLLAKREGTWEEIKSYEFDRRNAMDQLGFNDYPPVVVSFPEINTSELKLELHDINPINSPQPGLSEIQFKSIPQLEYFVEKELGKMHQTPLPLEDAYKWPNQSEPKDKSSIIRTDSILDISNKLSEDGILKWKAPQGEWTLLRMGMTTTGIKNAPAAANAKGLEVDKINRKALRQHFEGFVGKILKDMPASDRKALKYVVGDSYETGSQNWTDDFARTFQEAYGYNPKEYLPVLTGRIVNSVDQSNRFLWDLRRLVADKVAYEYVGGLRELCEENGLQLWLENYGHWGFPSEFLLYGGQSNLIGGEFWAEGDLGSIECRAASSAAHIYGKNQVSAESYTAAQRPFLRYPGSLKKRGDWSFTEGINHVVFHVYIEQAYDSVPGVNAWFGTEFNRNNTWFNKAKSWIDYQRRNQVMLQSGNYVADIAYFIGDDAPKMTGVKNPKLPKGYSFDYINSDVIMNRLSVQNGRLTLPSGLSYRILVLPDVETIRPELLQKIQDLVSQGAVIMGQPPKRSPSLENYGEADKKVKALAQELWQKTGDSIKNVSEFENGKILMPMDLGVALDDLSEVPDFKTDKEVPVLWIHRHTPANEIYFITNQSDTVQSFKASFRVSDMKPEFWDATTGNMRFLPQYKKEENFISVPITMEPAQSGYIVFSKTEKEPEQNLKNFGTASVIKKIENDWEVHFENEKTGIDKTIEMGSLTDWTKIEDQELKYFSGTATYTTSFKLKKMPFSKNIFLDIGKVNVIANVKLNGKKVGGLWTAPWQIDVSKFLKKGKNTLEIEVTNLWVNQLIKDAGRSKEDKKTWTLTPTYDSKSELQPSGLVGPVRLVSFDEVYGNNK